MTVMRPAGATMPVPLGVVFDLDGTLVLSHHDFPRMRAAVVETAGRYGVARQRLTAKELIGTSQLLEAARRGLSASRTAAFDAEVGRELDAIEMEAVPRTTLRRGAEELLASLRDRSLVLGLFTRSSEPFCRAALSKTGLDEFFSRMRTRTEPGPAKPSPEALHLLLRKMEVRADRAVFVGDHLEDARCATRAGIHFYGVLPDPEQPNPTTDEEFLAAGATAVAADLAGIARLLDGLFTGGSRTRRPGSRTRSGGVRPRTSSSRRPSR